MTACRPWCRNHVIDPERDLSVCISDDLRLHFGYHGSDPIDTSEASVDLSVSTLDDDPRVMLHLDGDIAAALDPQRASALAWALLAKVAQANGDDTAAGFYQGSALECAAAAAKAGA